MDDLTQLGVGGIFALMVIERGFNFAKSVMEKRNGNGNGKSKNGTNTVITHVDEVLRQQRFENTLDKLADNIAKQTSLLERMDTNVTEARKGIDQLKAAAE